MGQQHIKRLSNVELERTNFQDKIQSITEDKIPIAGKFQGDIDSKSMTVTDTFYVLKENMKGPPILSENTLLTLGVMKYDPEGGFAVKATSKVPMGIEDLKKQFPEVFNGLGCFKNYKVHLQLVADAKPIIQRARPIPMHLIGKVKQAICKLIETGRMEWCPIDQPMTFVSPMVVIPKANKEEVRIAGDFRELNANLSRHRHIASPRIEDHLRKMNGLKYFFKLDIRHAYHQLELDEESKNLTTLSTPFGNIRHCHLSMGLKNAQDFFNAKMMEVLHRIPNVVNYRDDILGGGAMLKSCEEVLLMVLKLLSHHGLTLDASKCKLYLREMEFLGYTFTSEGIKPSAGKIQALIETLRPNTKEALHSFLCAALWNERFIHRFAEETAMLQDLARSHGSLCWTQETIDAYNRLKRALTKATLLHSFHPEMETGVFVDAGKKAHEQGKRGGFAAILAQSPKGCQSWRPIHFASRRMTDVESRYSQTELEAKAISWAIADKFAYYLTGAPCFTVFTDCKPLVPLFSGSRKNIPPRIECQVLATQHLDYQVQYRPGKCNPADFFSRNPLGRTSSDNLEEVSIVKQKKHWSFLQKKTAQCPMMGKLMSRIERNDWNKYNNDPFINPFIRVKDELCVVEGVVYRGELIVPPPALFKYISRMAHEAGHQGETRSISFLKQTYWWPNCTKFVQHAVRHCDQCQRVTRDIRKEPIKHEELPEKPFEAISVDFKGPFAGKYALVFMDLYSRWSDVAITTSTSMKAVKKHFLKYFAAHGTPKVIKSDNGPPFNGREFEEFAKEQNFRHRKITPHHPQANGEVENFMKTIKKTIERCNVAKLTFEEEIWNVLGAYRNTPHSTTGKTPASLVLKYPVRYGKLDLDPIVKPGSDTALDYLRDNMARTKQKE